MDAAKLLLDKGANIHAAEKQGLMGLHMAAFQKDAAMIDFLLANGAKIDERTANQVTPFLYAVLVNSIETVDYLIDRGADYSLCDAGGNSAHFYALMASPEMLKHVLGLNLDVTATNNGRNNVLMLAVRRTDISYVELLIDLFTDMNQRNIQGVPLLHLACYSMEADVIRCVLEHGADVEIRSKISGWTPLMASASMGDIEGMKLLLEFGADIHQIEKNYQMTALNVALMENELEAAKFLLSQGAPLTRIDPTGNCVLTWSTKSYDEATMEAIYDMMKDLDNIDYCLTNALGVACNDGNDKAVKLLISKGASLNAICRTGMSPLSSASYRGYSDLVRLLFEKGAKLHAEGSDGDQALFCAAMFSHEDCMKILLAHGADVNAKRQSGVSVLEWACQKGQKKAVAMLIEHGAKTDVLTPSGKLLIDSVSPEMRAYLISLGVAEAQPEPSDEA